MCHKPHSRAGSGLRQRGPASPGQLRALRRPGGACPGISPAPAGGLRIQSVHLVVISARFLSTWEPCVLGPFLMATFVQAPKQTRETIHSPSHPPRRPRPPPGSSGCALTSWVGKPSGATTEGQFPDVTLSPQCHLLLATILQAHVLRTTELRLGARLCVS